MIDDRDILRRLKRRLESARATVMLEFAFIAPLAVSLIVFAADFSRILRTEQQLEIAARVMADVEEHMADYYGNGATPSSVTKQVGKFYLRDVAHIVSDTGDAKVKGDCTTVLNPISKIVAFLNSIFGDDFCKSSSDASVLSVLAKILGGLVNLVTFRTVKYITDVVPHDREVKVTCAVYIKTLLPKETYAFFSLPTRDKGKIGIGQFTPDLTSSAFGTAWSQTLDPFSRHRVYCHMPVIDSVPIAPETYVRKIKSFFAKYF